MTTELAPMRAGEDAAPASNGRRSAVLFGVGIVFAAALTAAATLFAVSGAGPIGPASRTMLWLLCTSLALAALLTGVLGLRIVRLARSREAPETGARLHLRFATLFSLAAVAPAVIVAVFLGAAFSQGVEQWFSSRIKSVVESGADVGSAYLGQAYENVRGEVLAMSSDLDNARTGLTSDAPGYQRYLSRQASARSFVAAYVLGAQGAALASSAGAPAYRQLATADLLAADNGDIKIFIRDPPDQIRAVYRLKAYEHAYLYVIRQLDPQIVSTLLQFDKSVRDYRETEAGRGRLQTLFALSYLSTAWLVLLAAVWLGLSNATRIAEPIGALANAAERVASGDRGVRVRAGEQRDEVDALGRAFNRMSEQIGAQREALERAREDAERRSGFTQAVLSGVSAGVIGLDRDGRVTAANVSAEILLGVDHGALAGRRLTDAAPEFDELITLNPLARDEPRRVDLSREGRTLHLSVRASAAPGGEGLVLTFDDMTKLISAQRQEAWRDVARRIAHEIKNPLTPIQLSAERLKRKYGGQITTDVETFNRCTDTILRQVADIGRMVDEFSTFARMPTPRLAQEDLGELVRSTAFAQRLVFADTRFDVEAPEMAILLWCDGRLIAQALTNLMKNAAESIQTRRLADGEPKEGRVLVRLSETAEDARIEIIDNGAGFPATERERLFEPYVTRRAKGTGLGLAIVRRVVEDHGGRLELNDAPGPGPGAQVTVLLSRTLEHPAGGAANGESA
jgi:two-component system, NtrC family, nitrogen regulation sensor histidine kinase NtrY